MSASNVTMCEECWYESNPGREPIRMVTPKPDCCWRCHRWTNSGIRVRVTVAKLPELDRDAWIRAFNRLDAAVNHHRKANNLPGAWEDEPDEALYRARDKIISDLAKGNA